MTIKEMEEKCGMSRTNIRFYESEGLIRPARRENGYRVYSEEDAAVLMKVKLLRLMDVPLEEIRTMCAGEAELAQVLERHLERLRAQQVKQQRSGELARQMLDDGADFAGLDAHTYLARLEGGEEALNMDVKPKLNLPWRRYWARCLDYAFYNTLVSVALRDFRNQTMYVPVLTMLAMLVLEPLLLHLFGTTLGKTVFGIRVTDREGARLDFNTGVERTWTVMWEGEALRIPLVCQYFQYKSLDLAEKEIPLSWEEDSELTYTDDKNWRYVLFAAAYAGLIWADVMLGG